MNPNLFSRFAALNAALSPENLSCDGELSRLEVSARRLSIEKEWAALEGQAGRKVSREEIWNELISR